MIFRVMPVHIPENSSLKRQQGAFSPPEFYPETYDYIDFPFPTSFNMSLLSGWGGGWSSKMGLFLPFTCWSRVLFRWSVWVLNSNDLKIGPDFSVYPDFRLSKTSEERSRSHPCSSHFLISHLWADRNKIHPLVYVVPSNNMFVCFSCSMIAYNDSLIPFSASA